MRRLHAPASWVFAEDFHAPIVELTSLRKVMQFTLLKLAAISSCYQMMLVITKRAGPPLCAKRTSNRLGGPTTAVNSTSIKDGAERGGPAKNHICQICYFVQ